MSRLPEGTAVCLASTYPPQRCGIGTYAQQLARALAGQGARVVVCAEREGDLPAHCNDGLVEVHRVFERRGDWVSALADTAQQVGARVVHVQHAPDIFGVDDRLPALFERLRSAGIAGVVTLHTVYDRVSAALERQWGAGRFYAALGRTAGAVVIHQEAGAASTLVARGVSRERIAVVPHGTPELRLASRQEARAALDLPHDAPVAVSLGFIHVQKGVEVAVRAFAHLRCRAPRAQLVVAGSVRNPRWSTSAYLAAVHWLGRRAAVRFDERFLTEDDLAAYLAAADLVLLPYRQRYGSASGIVHLATAAACPMLCSASPKFDEVERVCGPDARVRSFRPRAWAERLEALFGDPQRLDAMRAKLREHAAVTAWPRVARRTLEVYARAVDTLAG